MPQASTEWDYFVAFFALIWTISAESNVGGERGVWHAKVSKPGAEPWTVQLYGHVAADKQKTST